MNQRIKLIKRMISNGKTGKAINSLIEMMENDSIDIKGFPENSYDEIIMLSSRVKIIKQKIRLGIISDKGEKLEMNKINYSLLKLINSLNQEKNQSNTGKNKNEITDIYNFSDLAIRRRIRNLNEILKTTEDANIIVDLGLCYLKLGMHDMCLIEIQKALILDSSDPRIYFYIAIALMENKPVKSLNHSIAKNVYQHLKSASLLDQRKEIEFFFIILKEEYYKYNGLKIPDCGIGFHIENIKKYKSIIVDYKNLGRFVSFNNDKLKSLYQYII